MEYVVFAVVMAGIILLLMLKGFYDYRKSEKSFIQKLHSDYGRLPEREYKPEQFANISHYYLKHQGEACIDDITWNDLNMDEVFKKMNYTYSAAGEEYLYYVLRSPCLREEELLHREELIEYFRNHSDQRVSCQFIFSRLGRTGKFSIYDYLDYLDQLGSRSNLSHYIAMVLIAAATGAMFVDLPMGLVALVCVLIYNNISYFKEKSEIDTYIVSFAYVFRLLDAVKKLRAQKIPPLEEEFEILRKSSASMSGYRRGSFLVMSGGRMSGSGNPLDMLLDFIRMGFHLDLIKFNQMLSEVRGHISEIDDMITVSGKIEAMIAVGAYRQALGEYCIPVFESQNERSPLIDAEALAHPLIDDAVRNDISARRGVLITGSNASGKSTFLKTVALNSILAQTIHTCLGSKYRAVMFQIISSMSLKDDVQGGDSYYMAEIKSLKRILDRIASEEEPVLCFVDEVLRGTNTVERIAASAQILKSMAGQNCICFAATHDIELTHLLEEQYDNYHFSEEIREDDISFSYRIMKGRASTRNAIKLLDIMGYEPVITREAESMAAEFLRSGRWHRLDAASSK